MIAWSRRESVDQFTRERSTMFGDRDACVRFVKSHPDHQVAVAQVHKVMLAMAMFRFVNTVGKKVVWRFLHLLYA